MSQLTTHILDASTGLPAPEVAVELLDSHGDLMLSVRTDSDGRAAVGPDVLPLGDYTLRFATRDHFDRLGVDSFYPFVAIAFTVDDASRHYHVPILLSPFAYTTYRGS